MTEDARNKKLTEAYRDLASESTSADLDDSVLRMAAREARSRYGIARAWVRPVAWAATIGLSLAIVLEVWQVIPPAPDSEPAAISEAVPEPLSTDEAPARLQRETARREDAPAAPGAVVTTMVSAPTNPGGGAAEELGAMRQAPQDLPEVKKSRSVELDNADAFAAKDIRILAEAEMQARQRAGEPASEAGEAYCDDAARKTAESWYECVEDLREAGETMFAATELDALRKAFPDFEVPATNR